MVGFLKRHRLSLLTLTVVIIVFAGWRLYPKKTLTDSIKIVKVKRGAVTETVSASGKVDAAVKEALRFQTSGQLVWVGIKEGDRVKKGQAIASLDKRELEKNLQKELNNYLNERWDFEEGREDYNVSTDNLDRYTLAHEIRRLLEKNQFDLNNTVLNVEIKDLALRFATLITPISGVVTRIDKPNAGVNITAATAEFEIADPESVEFIAEIDEVDIGSIKEGQKAKIFLDAYPDEEIKSQVKEVKFTSVITKGGGTAFQVKIDLPKNGTTKFRLGMNGEAEFTTKEKSNALLLPQEAITSKNSKTAVWVVDSNNKAQLKPVVLGIESEDKAEVLKGLKEGEKIIIEGFSELKEGFEIKQ